MTDRELALAKEQTRRTYIKYGIGGVLVAFIAATGAWYHSESRATAKKAQAKLEAKSHEASLEQQRLAFAHQKMSEAVSHFDSPRKMAPILRFLVRPQDEKGRLTEWAKLELEAATLLVRAEEQATDALTKAAGKLQKSATELRALHAQSPQTEERKVAISNAEQRAAQLLADYEEAKRLQASAVAAASPKSAPLPAPEQQGDAAVIELAVIQLFSESAGIRRSGHATLTAGEYHNDPRVIDALGSYLQSQERPSKDGIISMVRVLAQTRTSILSEHGETVRVLLARAKKNGAKTRKEASAIGKRISRYVKREER